MIEGAGQVGGVDLPGELGTTPKLLPKRALYRRTPLPQGEKEITVN